MNTSLTTNSYTGEAFLAALEADTLATPIVRVGMVKRAAKDSQTILFSESACDNWIEVPIAAIEAVRHISAAKCRDHEHPLVEMRFKEPEDRTARVFAELLRSVPTGVVGMDGAADDGVPDVVFQQSGGGTFGGPGAPLDPCKCLEWTSGGAYYIEWIRIAPGRRIPILRRLSFRSCKTWECSPR